MDQAVVHRGVAPHPTSRDKDEVLHNVPAGIERTARRITQLELIESAPQVIPRSRRP